MDSKFIICLLLGVCSTLAHPSSRTSRTDLPPVEEQIAQEVKTALPDITTFIQGVEDSKVVQPVSQSQVRDALLEEVKAILPDITAFLEAKDEYQEDILLKEIQSGLPAIIEALESDKKTQSDDKLFQVVQTALPLITEYYTNKKNKDILLDTLRTLLPSLTEPETESKLLLSEIQSILPSITAQLEMQKGPVKVKDLLEETLRDLLPTFSNGIQHDDKLFQQVQSALPIITNNLAAKKPAVAQTKDVLFATIKEILPSLTKMYELAEPSIRQDTLFQEISAVLPALTAQIEKEAVSTTDYSRKQLESDIVAVLPAITRMLGVDNNKYEQENAAFDRHVSPLVPGVLKYMEELEKLPDSEEVVSAVEQELQTIVPSVNAYLDAVSMVNSETQLRNHDPTIVYGPCEQPAQISWCNRHCIRKGFTGFLAEAKCERTNRGDNCVCRKRGPFGTNEIRFNMRNLDFQETKQGETAAAAAGKEETLGTTQPATGSGSSSGSKKPLFGKKPSASGKNPGAKRPVNKQPVHSGNSESDDSSNGITSVRKGGISYELIFTGEISDTKRVGETSGKSMSFTKSSNRILEVDSRGAVKSKLMQDIHSLTPSMKWLLDSFEVEESAPSKTPEESAVETEGESPDALEDGEKRSLTPQKYLITTMEIHLMLKGNDGKSKKDSKKKNQETVVLKDVKVFPLSQKSKGKTQDAVMEEMATVFDAVADIIEAQPQQQDS